MTEATSVSSEVEVGVEPAVAFQAFTEELDLWWVRGPINFWSDGSRVVAVRCEPGVGGRIMEVLDSPESGEVFVRAHITAWEPPARLCWDSAQDDVSTEVSFTPTPSGTLVRVLHTVPVDGTDSGGTAWSRVVPRWFGDWVARRDAVPHEVVDVSRLSLGVNYAKPVAAAHFLAAAFGFAPTDDLPEEEHPPGDGHGYHWIEFRIGTAMLHLFPLEGERSGAPTHLPWIYVDDLDGHYARARAAGAVIVEEPHPFPGETVYVAADPEGNRWRFSQARPTQR
ncbi:MAG TPA: VOC family protein [Acidimicrobiales bacterium]|jgi:uncharacterized glyoxalase superfamily protein PhnB